MNHCECPFPYIHPVLTVHRFPPSLIVHTWWPLTCLINRHNPCATDWKGLSWERFIMQLLSNSSLHSLSTPSSALSFTPFSVLSWLLLQRPLYYPESPSARLPNLAETAHWSSLRWTSQFHCYCSCEQVSRLVTTAVIVLWNIEIDPGVSDCLIIL